MRHDEKIDFHVSTEHVQRAIYFGRVRENRRVGQKFSDEPCLYLILPHMPLDMHIEAVTHHLLKNVIIPGFTRAMIEHELPWVREGPSPRRPAPPTINLSKDEEKHTEHHIYTHLLENWDEEAVAEAASCENARAQIHHLAWKYMREIFALRSDGYYLKDMILVGVTPCIEYTGTSDARESHGGRPDIPTPVTESLDVYDHDLDFSFLGSVRISCMNDYQLQKRNA
jgi:hypothetical protein